VLPIPKNGTYVKNQHGLRKAGRTLPLSAAQQGVLFGHLIDATGTAYTIGQFTEIAGALDVDLFCRATRHVVGASEALRLTVEPVEGGYLQRINDLEAYELPLIDLTAAADPRGAAEEVMAGLLAEPFDLAAGPLFRWALIRLSDDLWYWLQINHHIAVDGWSGALLARRVADGYTALRAGGDLAPLADDGLASLADDGIEAVFDGEQRYRSSRRFARDRDYWLGQLPDCEPARSWSGRGQGKGKASVRRSTVLSAALTARLRTASRGHGMAVMFVAASACLDALQTRDDHCILGLPMLGRAARADRSVPVMTSNVVPMRVDLAGNQTIDDLLGAIGRQVSAALRHQLYRNEDIRKDLGFGPSDADPFHLSVNLMPFDYDLGFGSCSSRTRNLSNGPVGGLSLLVYDQSDSPGLRVDCRGNRELYTEDELGGYLARLERLLEQLSGLDGDAPLALLI
jgi:enterobactin synthetase component F